MVAEAEPDIETRVELLEENVRLITVALEQARTWLVLLGSYSAEQYAQLYELERQSIEAIDQIRRVIGGGNE